VGAAGAMAKVVFTDDFGGRTDGAARRTTGILRV
jgi:hypothetical protein